MPHDAISCREVSSILLQKKWRIQGSFHWVVFKFVKRQDLAKKLSS